MKKLFFVSILSITLAMIILSCNNNVENPSPNLKLSKNNDLQVVDNRVVFKDFETFSIYLKKLTVQPNLDYLKDQYVSLGEALETKSNSTNYNYLKKIESSDFPEYYKIIFNSDGEFQIGNTIVWFDGKIKHFIDKKENLNKIKLNPSLSKKFVEVKSIKIEKTPNYRVSNPNYDARHQHEFYPLPAGGLHKYVHELHSYLDTYYNGFNYQTMGVLELRVKLEWYGSSSHQWKDSGESRQISVNISGNVQLWGNGNLLGTEPFSVYYSDTRNNNFLAYGFYNFGATNPYTISISPELSGNISQTMWSNSGNYWYNANSGNPLW